MRRRLEPASLAALWLAAVGAYWLTMPPDITFEDTPIFAGVCATLGLAHPPGYPAHTLFCAPFAKALEAMSFTHARGAALASAVAAAAAVVLLAGLLQRLTQSLAAAVLAAGLWGISPSLWGQAQIPEVYALNAFLVVATLACAHLYVAGGDRRWLVAMALATGLGLATHWPLYVIIYPAFLLWLAQGWRGVLADLRSPKLVLSCLVALLAGLSPYLHLLFVDPGSYRFDNEFEAGDFVAYVCREVYGLGGGDVSAKERIKATAQASLFFIGELHYVFGLLVVVGIAQLFAQRRWWVLAAVLWGMLSTTTMLAAIRPFEVAGQISRWVFAVYPIGSYAFAAIAMALALGWLMARLRLQAVVLAPAVVACLAVTAWARWPAMDRSGEDLALPSARLVLDGQPAGAFVLKSNGDLSFPLEYANYFREDGDGPELVRELEFFESIGSDGTLSLEEERRLAELGRPVAYVLKLDLKTIGQRFHGLNYSLAPDVAAGTIELDVHPGARKVIRDMLGLYGKRVRNAFTYVYMEQAMIGYATEVLVARQAGAPVPAADEELLDELLLTPVGQYARFLARVLHSTEPITPSTLESMAYQIEPHMAGLTPARRAEVMHVIANGRIQAGNIGGGQGLLELALAQWPNNGNAKVIVDLLQLHALQGRFQGYLELRMDYPGVDAGTALERSDALCSEALGRDCAP